MHNLEPYYNWNHLYNASEDANSPFYEREYSEFEFSDRIYDHLIHPQWDNMGSPTLFVKILFTDYDDGFAIVELIGEWNDCIENDIMTFVREVLEPLQSTGISKFIFIGENVLNFFGSDDEYYLEFDEENEDGWISLINFREHVLEEMSTTNIDQYYMWGGELNDLAWRKLSPHDLFYKIESTLEKRLL
mgnify:CR=1 FL=1